MKTSGMQKRILSSAAATITAANTTTIPIVVGFGINTPEHAKLILNSGADGIIVASKLIDKIKESRNNEARMLRQIKAFVSDMKKACKKITTTTNMKIVFMRIENK